MLQVKKVDLNLFKGPNNINGPTGKFACTCIFDEGEATGFGHEIGLQLTIVSVADYFPYPFCESV